ncbi:MarR family protein [Planctomycetes bacterium Poly30]|uniref:MarR family protein n=1 Tax=Saltatorellus ferox TaxID=2528018 RepID=A0A518EMK9_9BACT|nr:MarR family protein [Planctomycetes bacterium Poly30]
MNDSTATRLHSAAIHLLRRLRSTDLEVGVGPAKLSALSVLVFGGARSLGQLAAEEQVSAPTMSRIVRGLEGRGLVRRIPDPDDGRSIELRATAAGKRLLEKARRARLAQLESLLEALSPTERATLEAAVDAFEKLSRLPTDPLDDGRDRGPR